MSKEVVLCFFIFSLVTLLLWWLMFIINSNKVLHCQMNVRGKLHFFSLSAFTFLSQDFPEAFLWTLPKHYPRSHLQMSSVINRRPFWVLPPVLLSWEVLHHTIRTYFSSIQTFYFHCVYVQYLLFHVAFILPCLDCSCVTAETGEISVVFGLLHFTQQHQHILTTVYTQSNIMKAEIYFCWANKILFSSLHL